MSHARPLPISALSRVCPPSSLGFRTTAELPDVDRIVGQARATEAIDLAVGMAGPGWNVFALGPSGVGRMTALRQTLAREAARQPAPDDWCYVHDFDDPQRPRALRLPGGQAVVLRDAMLQLCGELQAVIVAAFEGEAYRARREALEQTAEARRDAILGSLEARATLAGIAIVRTPVGLAVAPMHDGKPIEPDAFHALPEPEQQRFREAMERLGDELQEFLHQLPIWTRELHRQVRALDREVTTAAVRHLTDELRARFAALPEVVGYLDAIEADVVEHAPEILAAAAAADGAPGEHPAAAAPMPAPLGSPPPDPFRRYRVNVLVDRDGQTGAPLVTEDHPTVANLVGRVEHAAQMGMLVTDFTLIRAGALHRANGGYLVLEAQKVLAQPYAWDALKRALRSGEIRIESVGQTLGLLAGAALEPAPIP
ncbi:MAG: ATP-binding protein, partial [Chloroflexota bacterium]